MKRLFGAGRCIKGLQGSGPASLQIPERAGPGRAKIQISNANFANMVSRMPLSARTAQRPAVQKIQSSKKGRQPEKPGSSKQQATTLLGIAHGSLTVAHNSLKMARNSLTPAHNFGPPAFQEAFSTHSRHAQIEREFYSFQSESVRTARFR